MKNELNSPLTDELNLDSGLPVRDESTAETGNDLKKKASDLGNTLYGYGEKGIEQAYNAYNHVKPYITHAYERVSCAANSAWHEARKKFEKAPEVMPHVEEKDVDEESSVNYKSLAP